MADFIVENALQMVIWPMLKRIKANRILKNRAKGN